MTAPEDTTILLFTPWRRRRGHKDPHSKPLRDPWYCVSVDRSRPRYRFPGIIIISKRRDIFPISIISFVVGSFNGFPVFAEMHIYYIGVSLLYFQRKTKILNVVSQRSFMISREHPDFIRIKLMKILSKFISPVGV